MAKKSTAVKEPKKGMEIHIPKPDFGRVIVTIVGDTPINIHRLGKKMMNEFEDRDHNKPKKKKLSRDYDAEFLDSLYYTDGKGNEIAAPKGLKPKLPRGLDFGFPASGFKKAMVSAARQFKNLKMSELRGRFYVNRTVEFVEVKGNPKLDKFWRRIGGKGPGTGTPDIGIRANVFPWSAKLEIQYLKNVISAESVLNLLNTAGFSVGVGEDRPDKTGNTFGMWHVQDGQCNE